MTFKQGRDPPGPFQSNFQSIWVIFGSFWTILSEKILSFFKFSCQILISKVQNLGQMFIKHRSGPSRYPKGSFWTISRSLFMSNFGLKDQKTPVFCPKTPVFHFLSSNFGFKITQKWSYFDFLSSQSMPSMTGQLS